MKKRTLAMVLAASMAAAMMTGCGSNSEAGSGDTAENQTAGNGGTDTETASGEKTKLYWQWPTTGEVGDALYDVEDRFNVMLDEEGIPAEVEFIPVSADESQKEAQLMVSAGEQLDIMVSMFTGIDGLVKSNLILPLDDVIEEYGQDIIAKSHTMTNCKYAGKLYGISSGGEDYSGGTYCIKTEYLDKYGITIDPDKIYTMDELEDIIKTVYDGEDGAKFGMVPWAGTYEPGNHAYFALGEPSGSLSGGAINFSAQGFDDPTIVDLFETDEYKEYAQRMYRWAQAGYIASDAAVTTEAPNDIISSDDCFGWFYWGNIGVADEMESWVGTKFTQINLQDYYRPDLGNASVMWNIPVTTANKELAVQVLNFIYKNTDAATLLQRGREGIEYEVLERGDDGYATQIKMAAGDQNSLEYHQSYGIYGNSLDWPALYPNTRELTDKRRELDENLPEDRTFCGAGYVFNSENVSTEISAVETVLGQYCMIVNCGAADPDTVLPEFISALKDAGIDTVIAENQKQLDEYMATLE